LIDMRRESEAAAAVVSVDLQENYRLAAMLAPFVDKIRYNPGHLYHHQRTRTWRDKVADLADLAAKHDCALRIGVNAGSVDPALAAAHTDSGGKSSRILTPGARAAWCVLIPTS